MSVHVSFLGCAMSAVLDGAEDWLNMLVFVPAINFVTMKVLNRVEEWNVL